MENTNNKNKIIHIIVLAVLLILAVGLTLVAINMRSPEKVIKREISKNTAAFSEREYILPMLINEQTLNLLASGSFSVDGKLVMESGETILPQNIRGLGLGLRLIGDIDSNSRTIGGQIGLLANNMQLANVQGYIDDNATTVYLPELCSKSFTFNNDNIVSQMKKSKLFGQYAKDIKGDFSLSPMDMIASLGSNINGNKYLKDNFKTALLKLGDMGEYTDAGMAEIDGKSYQTYDFTVNGEDYKKVAVDFIKDFRASNEYNDMLKTNLDMIYGLEIVSSYVALPTREDAEAQINAYLDDFVKKSEQSDFKDFVVHLTPVDGGIKFDFDSYQNNEDSIVCSGRFDRNTNSLLIDCDITYNTHTLTLAYNDTLENDGGSTLINDFTIRTEIDKVGFNFSNNSVYDRSNNAIKMDFAVNDDLKTVNHTANLNGTITKADNGEISVKADSITFDAFAFNGELGISQLKNVPTQITADNIKIFEMDFDQAIDLYSEVKGKISRLKKAFDMLG